MKRCPSCGDLTLGSSEYRGFLADLCPMCLYQVRVAIVTDLDRQGRLDGFRDPGPMPGGDDYPFLPSSTAAVADGIPY